MVKKRQTDICLFFYLDYINQFSIFVIRILERLTLQDKITNEFLEFQRKFEKAVAANEVIREYKKKCEEFYFNDVNNTLSQFTEKQKKEIANTYNIPISTKFSYAIVEQFLSFLTATKPFPRLVSTEQSTTDWTQTFAKLWHCLWSESQGTTQLGLAIKDSLNTGDGYLVVRKPNHLDESTMKVIFEYKPWKHIIIDPESRKADYSDADYIIIVDALRKSKAEEIYDVVIPDDIVSTRTHFGTVNDIANDYYPYGITETDKGKYIWVREIYEKKDINVYIGNNPFENMFGIVSISKPKSIEIPNPEKLMLRSQMEQMMLQAQEFATQSVRSDQMNQDLADEDGIISDSDDINEQKATVSAGNQDMQSQNSNQIAQLEQQISQMSQIMNQMPDKIPAYEFTTERKKSEEGKTISEKIICTEMVKSKKRRILSTLYIGDEKVDSYYIPGSTYPIINFPFNHFNSPNKIYGIIHFILDIVKAMNKYLSEVMFDISVNGHRKGFIWEGTIAEPTKLETDWAKPSSLISLKPNPTIPDAGKPFIMDPSPINQSISYMLEYFKTLIEYITGIYGVVQGDPGAAPNTFGATQSLQNFGTQRVKLYARNLEHSLENLVKVCINYIQAYTPRDTVLKYFDDNGDQQEVSLLEETEDLQFKVRVDVVSSLPTTQMLMTQMLGFIAQTAGDPTLTKFLTEQMLKTADFPEAKEIAKKMDVVEQIQQQLAQAQQQVEELGGQLKSLQNQSAQKEMASNVQLATAQAQDQISTEKQKVVDQMQMQPEQSNSMPSILTGG